MNDQDRDLREGVREVAAAARRDLGAHPDPDELAAYHAGALSAADEKRIQDHLVVCASCATALLDLASFADPAEDDEGGEIPAGLAEAVWEGVASRIRAEEGRLPNRPAAVIPFPRRSAASAVPRRHGLLAVAAALLLATVGLAVWAVSLQRTVGQLHRTVSELSRPQGNARVIDLDSGTLRSEGGSRPMRSVPAGTPFSIVLHPPSPARDKEYRVEIVRADGTRVASEPGLKPDALGLLVLAVPRNALGAGTVRFRLYEGEKETPIEEYALRVEGH